MSSAIRAPLSSEGITDGGLGSVFEERPRCLSGEALQRSAQRRDFPPTLSSPCCPPRTGPASSDAPTWPSRVRCRRSPPALMRGRNRPSVMMTPPALRKGRRSSGRLPLSHLRCRSSPRPARGFLARSRPPLRSRGMPSICVHGFARCQPNGVPRALRLQAYPPFHSMAVPVMNVRVMRVCMDHHLMPVHVRMSLAC